MHATCCHINSTATALQSSKAGFAIIIAPLAKAFGSNHKKMHQFWKTSMLVNSSCGWTSSTQPQQCTDGKSARQGLTYNATSSAFSTADDRMVG